MALPKLSVRGPMLRDPSGRAVFLRGVNYSHRTKSPPHVEWQKPAHFAQMKAWGFNCVRYVVLWSLIEPRPDEIDTAYLDHLEKVFEFEDFVGALAFTNRVGALAEEVNHHPNIELSWGRVKLTIFTHTVGGLSESDFVWAARAQELR